MSDSTPFYVDRAKGGRAACKLCKGNCPSGELRMAKLVPSPYGDNQSMKSWYHVHCFTDVLLKQRPNTKRVESINDIGNWDNISKEDQELILKKLNETEKLYAEKHSGKYTAKLIENKSLGSIKKNSVKSEPDTTDSGNIVEDNKFSTFIELCKRIAKVDAYTEKTAAVNSFFTKGIEKDNFKGDLGLWCKLLLPQVTKRVYNLKSKQLVKLFSKIFNIDHDDMLTDLEQGDVANTIQRFFSTSKVVQPASFSSLTIHNIEDFLENLSTLTKEEEQIYHFKKIVKKCTLDDMKMLIRLIKGDLRINAGPKHILEGVHPDSYNVFQTSRDLNMVLDRVLSKNNSSNDKGVSHKAVSAKLTLMTPVLPMLAEACKSIEMAMKKCPNGMYSEIKYDGERVQIHKKGTEFKYFSRALKPVMAHKVSLFKEHLPKAFPKGEDMILDAEVLMVDVCTGKPLPFGTLGVHKQSEFKDAEVCLFIFDCLYYNGEVLMNEPIWKRKKFLEENMIEVKNHVMLSELQFIEKPSDLAKMIAEVLQLGLEGLVLKDRESIYEPGKRHWLKVKKDYLFDGAMADTADLVVLGAWFGTGKKGGMMSVFLMGCLDKYKNKWVTVTKVHTGHDDSTLERLQKELGPLMLKISQDSNKVPSWLDCKKGMVPDFVALDPKKQPVWEITGTELTKANQHTADGISVRFPRVTRIRTDKDWQSATNLDELKHLYKTSKETSDVSLLNKLAASASGIETTNKKTKASPKKQNKLDNFLKKEPKQSPSKKSPDSPLVKLETKASNKNKLNGSNSDLSYDETDSKREIKRRKRHLNISEGTLSESYEETNKNKKKNTEETKKSEETETDVKREMKRKKRDLDSSQETIAELNETPAKVKRKDKTTVSGNKLYPDNPLPDAFKDKILSLYPDLISFSEDERKHFVRHWIAYGGVLVKSMRSANVDFVVHNNNCITYKEMQRLKEELRQGVRHVTKNWLIRCINEVALCDTTKYAVTVIPQKLY
ncbi:DNA ligase 3 [Bombyx mori]|uniref:DNA ligase n=1 Tax=Bombyx mori TaxID=7091 RepID=A0A8R1WH00_BOMMO|nr:DNA ligase 3 [Bombyx mori]